MLSDNGAQNSRHINPNEGTISRVPLRKHAYKNLATNLQRESVGNQVDIRKCLPSFT